MEKNGRPSLHSHPRTYSWTSLSYTLSISYYLAWPSRQGIISKAANIKRRSTSFIKNDHRHLMIHQILWDESTYRTFEFKKENQGIKKQYTTNVD